MEQYIALGDAVAAARRRRKWSQQDLAEALLALGWKIDRGSISRIESGSRRVAVDELMMLAVALSVPPTVLLFPPRADEVAVAPGIVATPYQGWRWLIGEERLGGEPIDVWSTGRASVALWREIDRCGEVVVAARSDLAYARHLANEEQIERAIRRQAEAYRELHQAAEAAWRQGVSTPRWTTETVQTWEALDLSWPPHDKSKELI